MISSSKQCYEEDQGTDLASDCVCVCVCVKQGLRKCLSEEVTGELRPEGQNKQE